MPLEEHCIRKYDEIVQLEKPNCKDTISTYFEGINSVPKKPTAEQNEEKVRIYNLQQKQRYNERMIRKYKRLELASVDTDNKNYYKGKVLQWTNANDNLIASSKGLLRKDTSRYKINGITKLDKTFSNNSANDNFIKSMKKGYDSKLKHFDIENANIKMKTSEHYPDMFKADLGNVNKELQIDMSKQFEKLTSKYKTSITEIKQTTIYDPVLNVKASGVQARTELNTEFNTSKLLIQDNLTDYDKYVERMKNNIATNHMVKVGDEDIGKYIITHEFGHSFSTVQKSKYGYEYKSWVGQDMKQIKTFDTKISELFNEYTNELSILDKERKDATNKMLFGDFSDETVSRIKELDNKYNDLLISKYSLTNEDEFMAEAFTDGEIGIKPSKYSTKVLSLIKEYFGV